jgi:hypothetical protein
VKPNRAVPERERAGSVSHGSRSLRDPIEESRGGGRDLVAFPNLPDLEQQPLRTVRARLEREKLAAGRCCLSRYLTQMIPREMAREGV